jgi:hypothetical protein
VRVCIVTDTSDNNAWEVVYEPGGLHFEAKNMTAEHPVDPISANCILDYLVAGSDQAVVDAHVRSRRYSVHHLGSTAVGAGFPFILFTLPVICIVRMLLVNVLRIRFEQHILQGFGF